MHFVCTGNACRSRIAEALARRLLGERGEPLSAGGVAHGLDPRAVRVMREIGVDLSGRREETLEELLAAEPGSFVLAVTVRDRLARACPAPLSARRVFRQAFGDPQTLARDALDDEEALAVSRCVRDEIGASALGRARGGAPSSRFLASEERVS